MFKRIVPLLVATYALWQWGAWYRQRKGERAAVESAEMTTWEGEGGSLRGTGNQLGSEPAQP